MKNERIPESWVKVLFDYDETRGILSWAVAAGRHGRIPAGTRAGSEHTDQDGYKCRYVSIDGKLYKATHLIWVWKTGKWPERTIDHKDCDGLNDRWDNLREAGGSEQKQNNRRRKDSGTGYKCVVHDKERNQYRWQVVVNGKRIKGKRFATAKEAYVDYCAHLPEWHGDFANDGSN